MYNSKEKKKYKLENAGQMHVVPKRLHPNKLRPRCKRDIQYPTKIGIQRWLIWEKKKEIAQPVLDSSDILLT
jgi:hypothetical protein